jgi:hypothetical protein
LWKTAAQKVVIGSTPDRVLQQQECSRELRTDVGQNRQRAQRNAGDVSLHRDFDSFSLMVRSAGDARASRTMAASAAPPGLSFETAGKSRPPQTRKSVLNQSKPLCQGTVFPRAVVFIQEFDFVLPK